MTGKTILLRQINPKFKSAQAPGFTYNVFIPASRDLNNTTNTYELSVYDGDRITPENAFTKHNSLFKGKTVGVCGIACSEVDALGVLHDSSPTQKIQEHAHIDFCTGDKKHAKKIALQLFARAERRGRLHPPQ